MTEADSSSQLRSSLLVDLTHRRLRPSIFVGTEKPFEDWIGNYRADRVIVFVLITSLEITREAPADSEGISRPVKQPFHTIQRVVGDQIRARASRREASSVSVALLVKSSAGAGAAASASTFLTMHQCGTAIFFTSPRGHFLSSSCRPPHQTPLPMSINIPPFPSSLFLSSSSSPSPLYFPTFSVRSKNNIPAFQSLLFNPNGYNIGAAAAAASSATSTTMSEYKEKDPRVDGIASSIRVVPNFPKPGIMFQDITTLLLNTKAFKNTIDLFVERYKGKNITVVAALFCHLLTSLLQSVTVAVVAVKPRNPKPDFFPSFRKVATTVGSLNKELTACVPVPTLSWDAINLHSEGFFPTRTVVLIACTGVEARGFIFGPPIALAIGAKFVPLRKPRKLPGEVISEEYVLEYGRDCLEMHIGAVEHGDRALVVDDLIATGGTLCAAIKLLERVGADVVECACVIELPELK
ncbi:hypothetical protein ACLOJK_033401 [Asimina triloba]